MGGIARVGLPIDVGARQPHSGAPEFLERPRRARAQIGVGPCPFVPSLGGDGLHERATGEVEPFDRETLVEMAVRLDKRRRDEPAVEIDIRVAVREPHDPLAANDEMTHQAVALSSAAEGLWVCYQRQRRADVAKYDVVLFRLRCAPHQADRMAPPAGEAADHWRKASLSLPDRMSCSVGR
ncbi:hypothetical protein CHELA20_11546 [Hyphomicrobiales bacterium]|nr:hypothetical protein CHELA20_11546 [Hyphomicrobiales bacterium]CAH1695966.1 hypothetical protein CHELA41_51792 [Hyphomicrobiales bacterium]